MNIKEVFSISAVIIASLGGGGIMVFALSSFLGKIWANRILNEHKAKLDKDIEEIKNKHTIEIEKYKIELEKARADYHRFTNKKFEIIEETWTALCEAIKELKIYNKLEGSSYIDFLDDHIKILLKYFNVIKKNSLYFNDEIRKLLDDYISLCSQVIFDASERMKNFKNEIDFKDIVQSIAKNATERDQLLEKIRVEFKKELGGC